MNHKEGFEVERAMKKWFHGESHWSDSVDFQTKKNLFEVKSCRLMVHCNNGNHNRPYKDKPHKKVKTDQLGRFVIHLHNHQGIKTISEKENKEPKYIFVLVVEKQKIWKIKPWAEVDPLINKSKEGSFIKIKDIWDGIL